MVGLTAILGENFLVLVRFQVLAVANKKMTTSRISLNLGWLIGEEDEAGLVQRRFSYPDCGASSSDWLHRISLRNSYHYI